jgi:acetyl esterase/lipase
MRLAVVFLFCSLLAAAGQAAEPTLADVHYGPHERHVLDFFKAASEGPTPVLIFFHGGGFRGGDKGVFRERANGFLQAGISVVSANYRLNYQATYPAPMLDGARVVQFVRWKAKEWNIDASRVALSGSSAGATMALWIALHDDLADPASPDPVARISTRVSCASVKNGPSSMDPEFILKYLGATDLGAMLALHGVKTREEYMTPKMRKQALDASPLEHASPDDPPLFLDYAGDLTPTPLPADTRFGVWIHHPRFGELLKEKCDKLGLECHFYHRGKPAPAGAELAFLRKAFNRAAGQKTEGGRQ